MSAEILSLSSRFFETNFTTSSSSFEYLQISAQLRTSFKVDWMSPESRYHDSCSSIKDDTPAHVCHIADLLHDKLQDH